MMQLVVLILMMLLRWMSMMIFPRLRMMVMRLMVTSES